MPWEPLPGGPSEPVRVDHALDEVMTRLSGASVDATGVIFDRWADIVGAGLAGLSRPIKLHDDVLRVRADDATIGAELRFMERTIIDRVTEIAGSCPFTRVRVVVGA